MTHTTPDILTEPAHAYYVSTQTSLLDMPWTLAQLQATYFGASRTMDQLVEQVRNSMTFGVYRRDYLVPPGYPSHHDEQVGFARVVTDRVSFGWVCDFLVGEKSRGRGVGHNLMHVITNHHELRNVTLNLVTRTAGGFYSKFGFKPGEHMLRRPDTPAA